MESNMELKQELQNLIEEKKQLKNDSELTKSFYKKITKIIKIVFGVSVALAIPFIFYGNGILPSALLTPVIYGLIFGGFGALMSIAAYGLFASGFGIIKIMDKLSINKNQKRINEIKRKLNLPIQTNSKVNNNTKKPIVQKPVQRKPVQTPVQETVQRTPVQNPTTPKYSYKPTNNQPMKKEYDPKDYIRIIDGKVCFVDPNEITNNKQKSRTLKK